LKKSSGSDLVDEDYDDVADCRGAVVSATTTAT